MKSKRRTLELTIYLADSVLKQFGYRLDDPELFCVATIFLVLKFETDINACVANFFHFVINDLNMSISRIIRTEGEILLALPPEFCLLNPLCDIFNTVIIPATDQMENRTNPQEVVSRNLLDMYTYHGITFNQFGHFIGSFIMPVKKSITSCKNQEKGFGFVTTLDPVLPHKRTPNARRLLPAPDIDHKSVRRKKRVKLE
jgi:hypothetical protein